MSLLTSQIECHGDGDKENFSCEFTDNQGIEKEIDNVTFFNYELSGAKFESYKQKDTNEVILKVAFNPPANCQILGTLFKSITVNCSSR
ncbi:MAG: hypothetical protein ACTSQ8_24095 [Candidatus Helarchaeota archaeon]